ncbi:MAG: hypothetical protein JWM80_986 [Cyanobacteria bacterium RYN_339]|nr:hypothetical protein [Cyanobacteria bacterium RYN_339]
MIQPMRLPAITLAMLLAFALPAEAHVVYFKDGTSIRGTVTVTAANLSVKGGGTELTFPLDSVRAVSFSDEPIAYEQRRLEDSKFLNNDVVLWTAIGVNVVAMAALLVTVFKP